MLANYFLIPIALLLLVSQVCQSQFFTTPSWEDPDAVVQIDLKDQVIANLTLDDFPSLNQEASLLRYGELTTNLKCLRLFQARDFDGDWGDLCNSNELLSRGFIWSTRSVCSPADQWYESKRYWLLFEEPGFRGRYIMLAGERCIGRLERTRLSTLGSVLQCSLERGVSAKKVKCHYPPEPWRRFRPFSEREARQEIQKSAEMVNKASAPVVGAVSATVGAGPVFANKPTELNLDDLTKNSLEVGN